MVALPTSIAAHPSGKFAYTTHEVLLEGTPVENVSTYTIDAVSGSITRSGAPPGVASFPTSITVDPSGRFA